ncbi:type IV pilus assembly protein PilY1 [Dyella sp. OK004]|uniref:pilus assembly protein n=1 Tax=Dyella sp. OK004 TaxID=1855292 RepID=UPI0008EB5DA8|nr:PilC/PilY family type IV pilus protein [Dyella sp. OK004]SFS19191.1 type IV pilus assembly protein PilY1 [Dyella sp. OK004]
MNMRISVTGHQRLSALIGSLLLSLMAGYSAVSMAGTVELSPGPPAATITVAPNLVLTFDDSGSMGSDFVGDFRPYEFNANGTPGTAGWNSDRWKCAGVIDPTITDTTDPRSWVMNGVYFNPKNTYALPLKADGKTTLAAASFSAAWSDGITQNRPTNPSNSSKTDLAKATFCGKTGAGYYRYTGPALSKDADGRLTTGSQSALYTSGNWTWVPLDSKDQQNFANWYSYYRTRRMAAVSAISLAFAPLKDNVRVAWQNINSNELSNATKIYKFIDGAVTSNVRTSFYNWLFAIPASGGTPNRSAAKRVGTYFTDRSGSDDSNPYWDRDVNKELICRKNFHIQMTDGLWNGDTGVTTPGTDTANRSLPDGVQSFSTTDPESKVVWNEASNTTPTMGDIAFHYWATDLQAGLNSSTTSLFGKETNRRRVPVNIVDLSTTMFSKPLADGADPRSNKEIFWNPANDPATWPHLVQYMIGFGASGNLINNDATYEKLRKGSLAWPVPAVGTDDGRKIDDMWHAALNSRGKYFGVSSPSALVDALEKIISSILLQTTTPMAGGLNAAVLTTGSVTYLAGFDPATWSGSLKAFAIGLDGTVGTAALWDGRSLLDARSLDSRVILTSTDVGAGKGAAFTWANVSAALKTVDANFDAKGVGESRLAWLRGNRSNEGTTFRKRGSIFGPVINGQTVYLAAPTGGYLNTWPKDSPEAKGAEAKKSYEQFRADHLKRAPTLYVAANDGMLHAFDATTSTTDATKVDVTPSPGKERWAYVPYSAYGRLRGWSSLTDFSFMPSVDGTPVTRDVYFGTGSKQGWHTILVAGLRLGGRGVYALDVTEAASTESSTSGKVMGPADRVLWEFNNTSTGGANLGYTFGRPNIGRLANGKWVVLVPAGYFPEGSTETAAANAFSSLFVLDAQTGELLRELKTPTTVTGITDAIESYGLSTPVMGDYNSDQVDDVAFAGDLLGNMWRFDLTDGDPSNWTTELFFRPKNPGYRPVTVMPRLFPTPGASGFTVVFGTGKYLGGKDNVVDDNTRVQAVYGIRDSGKAGQAVVVEGKTLLVQQTLVEADNVRGLTTRTVPAADADKKPIRGWYFDLDIAAAKGERVVVDATALFDSGRAIITTLIPQTNDPCDPAPRGALMVIDAATGGAAQGVDFGAIAGWPAGYTQAGARVTNPPTGGFLPATVSMGGGKVFVPGVDVDKEPKETFSFGDTVWRRRSWRALNNDR